MYSSYAPARAILWQIYWRNRWGFAIAMAYLLIAIATSHWLTPYARTHWGDAGVAMVGLYLGAPCALIIVMVIAVFCMSGNRMGEVCPPTHMLVLPISARMLVAVPMVAGAATVAIIWLIVAYLVLRPADFTVPILGPTAALTLFLTVFQAIAWSPFAQKWIQGILTVFAGAGTFGWVLGGIAFGFTRFGSTAEPLVVAGLILALVPVAYLFALSGVSMSRRGDCYDWRLWSRLMDRIAKWRKPAEHPFSSPRAAQVWFELRSCGWYPPVLTAGICIFLMFVLLDDPSDVAQSWKFFGMFLGLPLLMATVSGGALGNFGGIETSAKAPQGPYLFTRPIASTTFVRDKLVAAALVVLMIWLVALPFGLLLLLRPGFCQAIIDIARQAPAWKVALLPPLAVLLLLATTWKQLVEGYWFTLTGRVWLMHLFGVALMFLLMGGMSFGIAAAIYPQYQAMAIAAVPWTLTVLLTVKIVVAVVVLRALIRSELMPTESLIAMVAAWVFVVTLLASIALWLIPTGGASTMNILGGIILSVPFSRLAGRAARRRMEPASIAERSAMGFYSQIIFPRICDYLLGQPFIGEYRKELLHSVEGRILEIGFGTGLNLPHYPESVRRISTVDPNAGMHRLAQRRIEQTGIEVDHHRLRSEALPFADGAFDCVVSTFTLCSVADPTKATSEIFRVLRPGGHFLFFEHGLSPEPAIQKWQQRMNWLQSLLGDGCKLDRNIKQLVAAQPYSAIDSREHYLEKMPKISGYVYRGVATK